MSRSRTYLDELLHLHYSYTTVIKISGGWGTRKEVGGQGNDTVTVLVFLLVCYSLAVQFHCYCVTLLLLLLVLLTL